MHMHKPIKRVKGQGMTGEGRWFGSSEDDRWQCIVFLCFSQRQAGCRRVVNPNSIICVYTQQIFAGPLAQTLDKSKHPSQELQCSWKSERRGV